MDNVTLKKKLSTFVSDKGYLINVPEDLLHEILVSWENWEGSSKEFYSSIGFSYRQMAGLIGRAKRLKREGHFGASEFKLVKPPEGNEEPTSSIAPCGVCEIVWTGGKIIRFAKLETLVDFLKKVA